VRRACGKLFLALLPAVFTLQHGKSNQVLWWGKQIAVMKNVSFAFATIAV
jgi:hypothetical protein